MNEVKQIHIGRSSFTVSVDAYKELNEYLKAVTKQAGETGTDVAEEVELRIAELLIARGINDSIVIVPKDIAYLKQQLGEPSDFKDEDAATTAEHTTTTKRLFRDTENGMIAGVAAGLAAYFGIDALIVRIIFVALTFAGASGIIIYLLLWLLVPEAKTASDRLGMEGKPATVENLRRIVENADVPGAAQRASHGVSRVLRILVKIMLALVGIGLAMAGIGLIITAIMALVYGLAHGAQVAGTQLFPVGLEQHIILICWVVVAAIVAILLMIIGVTVVRRRRVAATWAMVSLMGLFIVAASIGGGLSFDAGSKIRSQYLALEHTRVIELQNFTSVSYNNDQYIPTNFIYGPKPEVHIRTLGKLDSSAIKITQNGENLNIDTTRYHPNTHCNFICPYGDTNTAITIVTPNYGLVPDVGHIPADIKTLMPSDN